MPAIGEKVEHPLHRVPVVGHGLDTTVEQQAPHPRYETMASGDPTRSTAPARSRSEGMSNSRHL